jgi:hypothetical protein
MRTIRLLGILAVFVVVACERSVQFPDHAPDSYYIVASANQIAGCYELTLSPRNEPSRRFDLPSRVELTLTDAVETPDGDFSAVPRAYRIDPLVRDGQSGVWMIPVPGRYQLEWKAAQLRVLAQLRRERQTGHLRGVALILSSTGVVDERVLRMRRIPCASARQANIVRPN